MTGVVILISVVLVWFVVGIEGQGSQQETKHTQKDSRTVELIRNLIDPKNMDASVRPHVSGSPVNVKVGLYIMGISNIDGVDMDFKVNMYFRMKWRDPRLAYDVIDDDLLLSSRIIHQIWTPDIYFTNEKEGRFHNVVLPNERLEISPDGTCVLSLRISSTLVCPMDLTRFPMDEQECFIKMESYSHPVKHMVLDWFEDKEITLNDALELPEMRIREIRTQGCNSNYTSNVESEEFSCLAASFVLVRLYGFFILQTYVPSVLIVVLSWVSFWLHVDATPARISLGVTTVLTMATYMSGSSLAIPKVSYPKAIDVWTSACMMFVFSALLEYAFANSLTRSGRKKKLRQGESQDSSDKTSDTGTDSRSQTGMMQCMSGDEAAKLLDHISRVAFPAAFALFNVIYWGVYLS